MKENPDVIVFTCNNSFPSGQKVAIGYTVDNATIAKEALKELIDRPGWESIRLGKHRCCEGEEGLHNLSRLVSWPYL